MLFFYNYMIITRMLTDQISISASTIPTRSHEHRSLEANHTTKFTKSKSHSNLKGIETLPL